MIALKLVVFAACTVALAVNVAAWHRASRAERLDEVDHQASPFSCALDPSWQCVNTKKWHACEGNIECLINEGVVI